VIKIKPISQAILNEGEDFILAFPITARRTMEIALAGFRVLRKHPLVYTWTSAPTLEPYGSEDATTDFNYVGEDGLGEGDDIFEIPDEYPWRIYHFGIGIRPSDVAVYRAYPAGYPTEGFAWKTPVSPGDKRDYFTGAESPFDNPTTVSESVVFYKLSFTIALSNFSAQSVKPVLKFLGAAYDVAMYRSKADLETLLSRNVRVITVGGLREFPWSIPEEWKHYIQEFMFFEVK